MPDPIYRFDFYFDYFAGGCLWPADDVTWEQFGSGPVDTDSRINLPEHLLRRIKELDARLPESLNQNDPGGPSPWAAEEWQRFKTQADHLYEDILAALGPGFKITHEHDFYPSLHLQCSEIDYSPAQTALLERFEQTGVVVDTALLLLQTLVADWYALSKTAALAGMQVFADRYVRDFQKFNPGENIADYFSIQIDPDVEPSGQHISFEEFLGPGFDIRSDQLKLFSYNPQSRILYHSVTEGFAKALLDPPHSIGKPGDPADQEYLQQLTRELTQMLRDYLREILHLENLLETDHLVIYQWSDDWSNYFDAGKEWWGTFFWTVYDTRRQTVAVIGASATD
ncbi:MAG: hypothetical protein L6Q97_03485 [Thermoanaerobaculia bacterium]|nr:hypothetical protein [Thermoanaerobaculia bacterium]